MQNAQTKQASSTIKSQTFDIKLQIAEHNLQKSRHFRPKAQEATTWSANQENQTTQACTKSTTSSDYSEYSILEQQPDGGNTKHGDDEHKPCSTARVRTWNFQAHKTCRTPR